MLKKAFILLAVLLSGFGIMMATTRDTVFAVEESRGIAAQPQEIWSVLVDVDAWPEWWPGIAAAELNPTWSQGAELALALQGRPEKTPATVESYRQFHQLSWRRPGILGSTTRTVLRLEQASDGVVVSMKSSLHGPQAFLARLTGEESFRKYQEQVLQALQECLAGKGLRADNGKGA